MYRFFGYSDNAFSSRGRGKYNKHQNTLTSVETEAIGSPHVGTKCTLVNFNPDMRIWLLLFGKWERIAFIVLWVAVMLKNIYFYYTVKVNLQDCQILFEKISRIINFIRDRKLFVGARAETGELFIPDPENRRLTIRIFTPPEKWDSPFGPHSNVLPVLIRCLAPEI